MQIELTSKAEELLAELHRIHPGRLDMMADRESREIEWLIEIGFIRRTRESIMITPVGIAYHMLCGQIKGICAHQGGAPCRET